MLEWRLSRGRYLAFWAAVALIQAVPMVVPLGMAGTVAWFAVWQLAKMPLAIARMNDLGNAPEDAVFATLIPVANLYVFFAILLGKTPSAKVRDKRIARWKGQPSWLSAAAPALGLMAKTAAPGGLALLVMGVPITVLQEQMESWVGAGWATWTPEQLGQYTNGMAAVTAFLGLYTLIQLSKRHSASPASWIPTVAFLPSLLVTGALAFTASAAYGTLVPLRVGLMAMALSSFWYSTVGAFTVLVWVLSVHAAHEGLDGGLDTLAGKVREKLVVVMPSHAARTQLVLVGAQVIVPGLFYWVYAAFVVMVGALEEPPRHPLTTRSGKLTWGMMSRLVKLCGVYILLLLGAMCMVIPINGMPAFQGAFVGDLSLVPLSTQLLVELVGDLALWWVTVELYLFYRARVSQLDARKAAKSESAPVPAAEVV